MLTAPPPERHFTGAPLRLAEALRDGDAEAVSALAADVDLAAHGAEGITLLAFAVMAAGDLSDARLACVTALVRAGADPTQPVDAIGSVWEAALTARTPAFARALLDGGLAPDTPVGRATPPLFVCASETTVETMRLLLARGVDLDARNALGDTALVQAVHTEQYDQAAELLARGASPDVVNVRGETFLWALWRARERSLEGSPARARLDAIRDDIVWEGRRAWPPPTPREERARLREQGWEPVVPYGEER